MCNHASLFISGVVVHGMVPNVIPDRYVAYIYGYPDVVNIPGQSVHICTVYMSDERNCFQGKLYPVHTCTVAQRRKWYES